MSIHTMEISANLPMMQIRAPSMVILEPVLLLGLSCWVAFLLYRLKMQGREDAPPSAPVETFAVTDKLYASLFDRAPIGYLEIDRQGIVQRVNRKECELRGL